MFKAVEALTKGMEVPLPGGRCFHDADGHKRYRIRVQWWQSGNISFADAAEAPPSVRDQLHETGCDAPVPPHALPGYVCDAPVIFGHYWRSGMPAVINEGRLACIDYSIGKGGKLVAYRWDGEPRLLNSNFVTV